MNGYSVKKHIGFGCILFLTFSCHCSQLSLVKLPTSTLSKAGSTLALAASRTIGSLGMPNIAKIGLFSAAATSVSVYGFTYAKRFLQQSRASSACQEANKILKSMEQYKDIITTYQKYDLGPSTPVDYVTEEKLEELAQVKQTPFIPFMTNLGTLITDLEHHAKIILSRSTQIDESAPLLTSLRDTDQQMQRALPQLKCLQQIMASQSTYFKSYDSTTKSHDLAVKAGNKYAQLLATLSKSYGEQFSGHEKEDEKLVKQLAEKKEQKFDSFMASLQQTISSLQAELQSVSGTEYYQGIRTKKGSLEKFVGQLCSLHTFMQKNATYFKLAEEKAAVIYRYGDGSHALSLPATAYPHLELLPKLDQDLEQLRRINESRSSRMYPTQHEQIDALIENLTIQRNKIYPLYNQELKAKDQADKEERQRQEQLEIQRKAADDARRRDQETRRYQQAQLHLQEKQLRAQKKANELFLLQQRLQAGTITKEQFEIERAKIEESYSSAEFRAAFEELGAAAGKAAVETVCKVQ